MRSTTIIALLALLCLLSVAFAAPEVKAAAPTVDTTQIKALQEKIAKLEADLTTIRSTISSVQKENANLTKKVQEAASKAEKAATPVAPKQDPKVSELDNTVAQLRKTIADLAAKVDQLSISAQLKEQVQTVKHFYSTQVGPKVDQGIKLASVYATKATAAVVPLFGQTQGVLSKLYHQIRALISQYKPQVHKFLIPHLSKIPQIPAEHRPRVVDAVFTGIVFFIGFTIFIIAYKILALILSFICPCSKKQDAKKQQARRS